MWIFYIWLYICVASSHTWISDLDKNMDNNNNNNNNYLHNTQQSRKESPFSAFEPPSSNTMYESTVIANGGERERESEREREEEDPISEPLVLREFAKEKYQKISLVKSSKILTEEKLKPKNARFKSWLHKEILRMEEQWTYTKTLANNNYEFIFEWNCFCSTCLEIAKSIQVVNDRIINVAFTDMSEFKTLQIPKNGCDDLYLDASHYHTIDKLFEIMRHASHPNSYDPNRHFIELEFDEQLSYPSRVSIAHDLHNIGWHIRCLSTDAHHQKCSNLESKYIPFWIEQKWGEFIGWLMFGLVCLLCCIGFCIGWLKKRSRKIHRHALQQNQRSSQQQQQRQQQQHQQQQQQQQQQQRRPASTQPLSNNNNINNNNINNNNATNHTQQR